MFRRERDFQDRVLAMLDDIKQVVSTPPVDVVHLQDLLAQAMAHATQLEDEVAVMTVDIYSDDSTIRDLQNKLKNALSDAADVLRDLS